MGSANKQTKPWISDSTWKHIESRRLIKNQLHSTHDPAKKSEMGLLYESADSAVKERASNDKDVCYNKIASKAEATAYRNGLRSVYTSISKITNVKSHIPPLEDQYGSILLRVVEQIAEW